MMQVKERGNSKCRIAPPAQASIRLLPICIKIDVQRDRIAKRLLMTYTLHDNDGINLHSSKFRGMLVQQLFCLGTCFEAFQVVARPIRFH
ncbi:Heterokaryon incompatibility protein 6, OR allele [Fusarium oxysporum f. sp. albedinis]|nr:Heterokaryon incompatibility protein 6, OR allele [Fusarium oxysporum f. sp. albedinis]